MHKRVQEYINQINRSTDDTWDIYLRDLYLTDQDIAPLMDMLGNNKIAASKITSISIHYNHLEHITIPATLVKLKKLHLGNNNLTTLIIPETLVALQELHLEQNALKAITIPATLIALQTLNLSNNKLTTLVIPETLVALQTLSLSYNKLTTLIIPETLNKLENLYLNKNKLITLIIPKTLVKLKDLHLHNNKLINIIFPEYLPYINVLSIQDNSLSLTSLIALRAFNIKNRSSRLTYSLQSHFGNIKSSLHFDNITTDLPVTFKRLISNLPAATQEQYLLDFLKESINLALISAPTLEKNMRFNGDLMFSAAKFNMPFSSFEKHITNNNDMIIRLLNIFNIHDDMQIPSTERNFFNTSLLAIEEYQKEHIDDLNNIDLINAFNKEQDQFVKGIYDLLQSLRDMDGIKNETTTREFFDKLKPILIDTGFREEALDPKKNCYQY
jgi:hypothetical protein